jgi:hypothetical protein
MLTQATTLGSTIFAIAAVILHGFIVIYFLSSKSVLRIFRIGN